MSRTPVIVLALAALGGCTAFDPDPSLTRFADCDDFGDYMARMAKQEVLYDWRWEPEGFILGGAMKEDFAAMDAGGDTGEAAGSYSGTNLQEEDVDEADLMKTDGTYLYALAAGQLVVSRAWPPEAAEVLATVALDGDTDGIYLYGDYVVALGTVWAPSPHSGKALGISSEGGYTLVTVVDVSDPSAPAVVRETYAAGSLVESRRIADRLFVVTYQDLDVVGSASDAREARARVKDADPEDWLPLRSDHRLFGGWEVDAGTVCDCDRVWASEREGGSWLTTVMSLDLSDPTSSFEGDAVVGTADTVYASPNAIYIGASEYSEGPFPSIDGTLETVLHKFNLGSEDAHPQYRATAKVLGTLKDQFGLSEYEGVLRVATTEWEDRSSAMVHTLQEADGSFTTLDSLDGLGEGEEIFATRFVRDMGYVVTFLQVDPLFVLDLSDPMDIRAGGALEVTGWSDYLHPLDDDHLLSVGMDEDGSDWRLAVSLFDVSDFEAPVLADRELLDAWGSESQYEHHAFNYFAASNSLTIPSWSLSYEPVLEVLDARVEGLTYTGQVRQDAVLAAFGRDVSDCAPIRRSVIMEDYAYALSNAGFTVTSLADPATAVAAVPYLAVDPCASTDSGYYGSEW